MTKHIISIIMLFFPCIVNAQWSFDVASIEAYISDHKTQRSLLLARATLEQSNALLHQYSGKATEDYKDINVVLDRYTRAFDVIDIVYQSTRTALNVYSTYRGVSDRIGDYKRLIDDYKDKILPRRGISFSDTIIITVNTRAIEQITKEATHLYRSVSDLILYATGAAACSTADLMVVFESINNSLDMIEAHLNHAYFDTWRYIQLRLGYWKEDVYRTKSRREIIEGALGRWREASHEPIK